MKTLLSAFVLLLASHRGVVLADPIYGPLEENACEIQLPFSPFSFDIKNLYRTKCDEILHQKKEFYKIFTSEDEHKKDNKDRYCQCLSDVADGNILVSTRLNRLDDSEQVKDEIDKVKKDYFDRFYSVYDQMTMGASIQAKIFNIEEVGKSQEGTIGCTPKLISASIQSKISENVPKQTDALKKMLEKSESRLKICKKKHKNCQQLEKVKQRINLNIANLKSMDSCFVQLTVIKSELTSSKDGLSKKRHETLSLEDKRIALKSINRMLDPEKFEVLSESFLYLGITCPGFDELMCCS